MKNLTRFVLATFATTASAQAAVLYTNPGDTYSQNFDRTAGGAVTAPWVNNSVVSQWYAYQFGSAGGGTDTPGAIAQYRATNGSSTGIVLYLFRSSTTTTDYALGTKPNDTSGDLAVGFALQNNTGQTLTSFNLAYTGEQWTDQTTTANVLRTAYRTGNDEDANSLGTGTWTDIPSLLFTSPTNLNSTATLDGNAAANRVVFPAVTVTGLNWAPGDLLWLRFFDNNSTGADQGLAVDDLSFSAAVPEPAAAMLATAFLGAMTLRRRRTRRAS